LSRRALIPVVALFLLLLGASSARAAPYEIQFEPDPVVAGQDATFHAVRTNPGSGDGDAFSWDFGDGSAPVAGAVATHTYAAPGLYTITLTGVGGDGTSTEVRQIEVAAAPPPNNAPDAAFTVAPASPLTGDSVTFTAGTDPDGDPVTYSWDFGDGATAAVGTPTTSHAYAIPGTYVATLTATDSRGGSATSSRTVTVSPRFDSSGGGTGAGPGGGTLGSVGSPGPGQGTPKLFKMRPFPVVRVAGVVLPRGARVRILSVTGPRRVRVQVRCRGRGCPLARVARRSRTRVLRIRAFERMLPAGTRLDVFVRKAGTIGKYTRIVIRAGRAPKRVDRCLIPGRSRPVRCR
jgi:PKD domain